VPSSIASRTASPRAIVRGCVPGGRPRPRELIAPSWGCLASLSVLAMTAQMLGRPHDGPALERWRRALGLSREALGAAAGGIASATVRRVERSEVKPHPSTLAALVAALNQATREQRPGGNRA
jgi:Helix-turn-helix